MLSLLIGGLGPAVFLLFLILKQAEAGLFPKWSFQQPKSRMELNIQQPIQICVKETLWNAGQYDCIVIVIPEKRTANAASTDLGWLFKQVDAKCSGIVSKWTEDIFRGKRRYTEDWVEVSKVLDGKMQVQRVILCRIRGDTSKDTRNLGRSIGSTLASKMKADGEKWAFLMPPLPPEAQTNPSTASHQCNEFLSGMTTALWSDLYKDIRPIASPKEKRRIAIDPRDSPLSLDLIFDHTTPAPTTPATLIDQARQSISKGESIASGICLAKDIINADFLSPLSLADVARRLAADFPQLSCQILNAADCESLGMGAFLGAAQGSETAPQFIHLIYRPRGASRRRKIRRLGVVGKGLLFDTGGYKRGMLELSKWDCGGAGAIFGAAKAIALLEPEDVEVHFVVPSCEHLINEKSMVPGDILTASNGKTVEVLNTDAEGRLTIADALVFVDQNLGCEEIVELSTMTDDSCTQALGPVAGLWCKSDAMATSLISASAGTGDLTWRMPLEEDHKEGLESEYADLNNLGGKHVGAAALFLQQFVSENKPFAHIDMAGPVWDSEAGASGWGTKLVAEWICQTARQHKEVSARDEEDSAGEEERLPHDRTAATNKQKPLF